MRTTGPKRKPPLCTCGCGEFVTRHYRGKKWNKYIKDHNGKGCSNGKWKGGLTIGERGYILINIEGKRVRRCRYVMELHLGRKLTRKEVVHHINEIRDDDTIENLQLFATQAEHVAFHLKGKPRPRSVCEKISKSQKGKTVALETKVKISNTLKGNTIWAGKKHTDESKRKMSEAKRGSTLTEEHKAKIAAAGVLRWAKRKGVCK